MYGNWRYLDSQTAPVLGLLNHVGFRDLALDVWKLEIFKLTDSSGSWIAIPCLI